MEIMPTDTIGAIERAQVDMQITTARKFPRELSKVKARMLSFATLDEETAASCFYTLPARKGGNDKPIQGPSVRMAEIALASYQHVKAGSRIVGDDGKFLTAQAVVHDLENNVAVSIEVRRRVTTKDGRRFGDDMIAVTGNAACSIALRNAVFRVVPRALISPVYEQAKRVAVGDVKSLTVKRAKVIDRLKAMGAKEEQIMASVGVSKAEDIDLEKLETLLGIGTAIKDGDVTLEEAFATQTSTTETKPTFGKAQNPKSDAVAATVPEVVKDAAPTDTAPKSPQDQLADIVTGAGFTFDQWQAWALASGFTKAEVDGFDSVSVALANRLIKSQSDMLAAMKEVVR